MPRKYVRKPGTRRRYAEYTKEQLQECLNEIKNGTISHRKAQLKYKIPRRRILNKLKGRYTRKPDHQHIFTSDEEENISQCIISLGEYGFPVNSMELQHVIKNYLGKCGRNVKSFKNNLPGKDWIKSFLIRNPVLSQRFTENVERTRAAVDEQMITSFFENVSKELKDPQTFGILMRRI